MVLELGSLDLVDGTPVVDIKPYLPFAESQPQAAPALRAAPAGDMPVRFAPQVSSSCSNIRRVTRN